jgi:hypothetical protein
MRDLKYFQPKSTPHVTTHGNGSGPSEIYRAGVFCDRAIFCISRFITSFDKSALELSTRLRGIESLTKSIRNTSSCPRSGFSLRDPRKKSLIGISEGVGDGEVSFTLSLSLSKRSRHLIGCPHSLRIARATPHHAV